MGVFEEDTSSNGAASGSAAPARLEVWLRHCPTGGSGGRLWGASELVARWLFANRNVLVGCRILELGCGLGLPALVAANLIRESGGALRGEVLATELQPALLANLKSNGKDLCSSLDGYAVFSVREFDFVAAHKSTAASAGMGDWNMVIFADCVYNSQMGAALPFTVRKLLKPRGVAIGTCPSHDRPGMNKFWESVQAAG